MLYYIVIYIYIYIYFYQYIGPKAPPVFGNRCLLFGRFPPGYWPFRTILVHKKVSRIRFFQDFGNKSQNIFLNMFIYKENDTESHRNTQNINI